MMRDVVPDTDDPRMCGWLSGASMARHLTWPSRPVFGLALWSLLLEMVPLPQLMRSTSAPTCRLPSSAVARGSSSCHLSPRPFAADGGHRHADLASARRPARRRATAAVETDRLLQCFGLAVTLQRENARAVLRRLPVPAQSHAPLTEP